ncbi:alpha/beta hydrolase [Streptomyces sp. ISL-10]|uniref:alpha/beta fold hydrolase n=1 Tax=Streptomyces sp. ISL-10 TaxID=2819172 RepID=UPI0027E5661E|nr:alpha/beta hydrolase [Streptomyces sp. ISL-10]
MRIDVRTDDGRTLVAEEWGAPDGTPVLLHHGTPGSRVGTALRDVTERHPQVRLFAYDRPGYGDSDRREGRRVADAAGDAAAVADALGIGTFAVVGRSGGAPHALACAALLPERVTGAAALVSPAPRDADGLSWFAGMTPMNVDEYTLATTDPAALERLLTALADEIRADPVRLLDQLRGALSKADEPVLADERVRAVLLANYRESVRVSAYGWFDDTLALATPWGFDPEVIERRVLLWHGAEDVFSPVGHFHWLVGRIPRCTAVLEPGAGHFTAQYALGRALEWLREG